MLENASFVHVFGCMCMLELTITGWWIIVSYLSIPNWFELQLVSQLASYLFSYFFCDPYFLFQIQNFFLYLVVIHYCYKGKVHILLFRYSASFHSIPVLIPIQCLETPLNIGYLSLPRGPSQVNLACDLKTN